jgi:hypothetical protein
VVRLLRMPLLYAQAAEGSGMMPMRRDEPRPILVHDKYVVGSMSKGLYFKVGGMRFVWCVCACVCGACCLSLVSCACPLLPHFSLTWTALFLGLCPAAGRNVPRCNLH